jgi:hypothetical protein
MTGCPFYATNFPNYMKYSASQVALYIILFFTGGFISGIMAHKLYVDVTVGKATYQKGGACPMPQNACKYAYHLDVEDNMYTLYNNMGERIGAARIDWKAPLDRLIEQDNDR